jgi:hypothetical protein
MLKGIPNRIEINPVIRIAKPIAHSADIVPRLVRHQGQSCLSKPECGLADALEASFDSIPRAPIVLESLLLQAGGITLNVGDVVQNVRKAVAGIVLRRHDVGLYRYPSASALSEPARVLDRLCASGFQPNDAPNRSVQRGRCERTDRVLQQHPHRCLPRPHRELPNRTATGGGSRIAATRVRAPVKSRSWPRPYYL